MKRHFEIARLGPIDGCLVGLSVGILLGFDVVGVFDGEVLGLNEVSWGPWILYRLGSSGFLDKGT